MNARFSGFSSRVAPRPAPRPGVRGADPCCRARPQDACAARVRETLILDPRSPERRFPGRDARDRLGHPPDDVARSTRGTSASRAGSVAAPPGLREALADGPDGLRDCRADLLGLPTATNKRSGFASGREARSRAIVRLHQSGSISSAPSLRFPHSGPSLRQRQPEQAGRPGPARRARRSGGPARGRTATGTRAGERGVTSRAIHTWPGSAPACASGRPRRSARRRGPRRTRAGPRRPSRPRTRD